MTEWLSLETTRIGKCINKTQKYNSFKYFKSKTKLQAELHCLLSVSSGQNLGSAWTLSSPSHPFLPSENSHFHHPCHSVPSLSLHTSCPPYCSHLLTDFLAPSLDPVKTWVRANYPLLKALQGLLFPLRENPDPRWLEKPLSSYRLSDLISYHLSSWSVCFSRTGPLSLFKYVKQTLPQGCRVGGSLSLECSSPSSAWPAASSSSSVFSNMTFRLSSSWTFY